MLGAGRVDLKKRGPWPYAENDSTDILCIGLKDGDSPAVVWLNHRIDWGWGILHPVITEAEMLIMVDAADKIIAHNAGFERAMWERCGVRKYGWPMIPANKWRCTAAGAASLGLPRSLGMVGEALDLDYKKSKDGYRAMMRMCKPDNKGKWVTSHIEDLLLYCVQDVETEYQLHKRLGLKWMS